MPFQNSESHPDGSHACIPHTPYRNRNLPVSGLPAQTAYYIISHTTRKSQFLLPVLSHRFPPDIPQPSSHPKNPSDRHPPPLSGGRNIPDCRLFPYTPANPAQASRFLHGEKIAAAPVHLSSRIWHPTVRWQCATHHLSRPLQSESAPAESGSLQSQYR